MDRRVIPNCRVWKYHVFLSFDQGLASYFAKRLIDALQSEDIITFTAKKKLKRQELVPSHIFEAIEESLICVVIFSPYYVNSVWCLEELAKIADGINHHIVLPVFYDVHSIEVRKQSHYYEGAFAKHETNFRDKLENVKKWRVALEKVASLRGWHPQKWNWTESQVIDEIVEFAMKTLGQDENNNGFVGMETRVIALEKLLNIGFDDDVVQFVGISGMCGIGKTCLARVLSERISHQFDSHVFIYNASQLGNGLDALHLYKYFLGEILMKDDCRVLLSGEGMTIIRDQLRHRKILLVLDNVNQLKQLEELVETFDWFGQGSRVIIITRNQNILRMLGVKTVYTAELLNEREALQLFCKIAFKCDYPLEGYQEWTHYILKYANGLPLAIKSLGLILFGQSPLEWGRFLETLQEDPEIDILLPLRSSLDGLDIFEMEIFLDIACFFRGEDESYVMEILDSCGFDPMIGIRDLQDKSLIKIVNGKIWMHDMLQQVGRQIVREESRERPGNRSRLWLIKDFLDIMETEKGMKRLEAIVLNPEALHETPLSAETLSEMRDLRVLIIHNVNFSGVLNRLSDNLRYISWHKYPFECLPLGFEAYRIAELIMPHSNIKHLRKEIKTFPKLRNIDLHGSKNLMEMPNFMGFQNLERLNLEGCTTLVRLDSSITILQKLKFLNLRNCDSLISIPNRLFSLKSLEILNLAGCSKLVKYLNFDPLRSSLEVKLLSIPCHPFLAKLLVFGCLSCLILSIVIFMLMIRFVIRM